MKGRYEECGKPFTLYYDGEYKETDADFEPAMPIRKGKEADGISVRRLDSSEMIHTGSLSFFRIPRGVT